MPSLDDEQIASFFALEEVQVAKRQIDAKESTSASVYFTIAMTETIKTILKESFNLELPQTIKTIPMRWIKGDVAPHVDVGVATFDNTYLLYLTDSPGELVVGGTSYPITKGSAHVFPESVRHETINTGSEPRLLLGPMSEEGFAVGGSVISGIGGTTVYIRQDGGEYQYRSEQEISWNVIAWQPEVRNTNPAEGMLTVEFVSDIILSSSNHCFICGSSNIQFGSTSLKLDGTRPIITIDGVLGYYGLIQNGAEFVSGYSNISIFNLVVDVSGSTLADGYGWFGQQFFGKEAAENYIVNCTSDGPISSGAGGIVGRRAGSGADASLKLIGCSSSGVIGNDGGGIVGRDAGFADGSITCESCWSTGIIDISSGGIIGSEASYATITNCYSTGVIRDGGGGICGRICGYSDRTVTITNCYSEGTIAANAGGIGGANTGIVSISNCYSLGAMAASTSGGIIAATNSTTYTVANCYTVGAVTGSQGYIIGASGEVPPTCYSEAKTGTAGTWRSTNASTYLLRAPAPIIGTTWVATIANQPYELFNMGYTPYSIPNIISPLSPVLFRSFGALVVAGSKTAAAIVSGKAYTRLDIAGGDAGSYSSITMDPATGVISTTGSTAPGLYTIYLRNTGSYNITEYTLVVTEAATGESIQPCCARPTFRRGPLIDNATLTALTAGNSYLASVRRGPIPYAQLMAMKKAKASK